MSRVIFHLTASALLCSGCGDKHGSDTGAGSDSDDTASPAEETQLSASLVFEVPERPWDLAVSAEGHIYCSAQAGGKVYAWDPVAEDRDEVFDDFDDILALAFSGDTLYITQSDNGVTGGLYRVDGTEAVELATQADDGTLMRRPTDFIEDGSGGWLLADNNAMLVFHVASSGAVTTFYGGTDEPLALALVDDTLYVGGDDGIFSMSWPGGTPSQVDSRAGLALLPVGDALWAVNATEDLFVVGGGTLGADDAARPGALAQSGGVVYFADQVGQGVWSVTP